MEGFLVRNHRDVREGLYDFAVPHPRIIARDRTQAAGTGGTPRAAVSGS